LLVQVSCTPVLSMAISIAFCQYSGGSTGFHLSYPFSNLCASEAFVSTKYWKTIVTISPFIYHSSFSDSHLSGFLCIVCKSQQKPTIVDDFGVSTDQTFNKNHHSQPFASFNR